MISSLHYKVTTESKQIYNNLYKSYLEALMNTYTELLSPAGDMEKLKMAVTYGADAVYLSGKQFGMRAGTANFSDDLLEEAVDYCHSLNRRVYVTCNTIPTNEEISLLPAHLSLLETLKVDGVIVADLGVLELCKKYCPSIEIHASTQVGVMNAETAKALYNLGARRIVLARETNIEDIAKIRKQIPSDMQIEAFCHGSMCMSFSGRCLLSAYLTGRDANRGMCAQPCRWKYHLVEETRPDQFFEITEDKGTYILNSKDLCTISILPQLIEAGVDSLKIEGRTKSSYYVASVTSAYRHAIDAYKNGHDLDKCWYDEVKMVSHRPYSTGFYYGEAQQYTQSSAYLSSCDVVGIVSECDSDGNAIITQRNKFYPNDDVNILTTNGKIISCNIGILFDENNNEIESANKAQMNVKARLPEYVPPDSFIRKLRTDPTVKNA